VSDDGERIVSQRPRGAQGSQGENGDGERMVFQGPRGAQGNQGNRGEQGATGLSIPVRRAVVFMFALAVILAVFGLFWINHAVHGSQAAIQASYVSEQQAQKRAAQTEFRALCTTFTKLAALQPPAGNPATNPSRAYLQGQHDTLDQLGTDLGCK